MGYYRYGKDGARYYRYRQDGVRYYRCYIIKLSKLPSILRGGGVTGRG